ncbi:MAG: AAA family ATPase [Ignavibacteriae bacterium]|nr:AAA family ATPase [Ignavibacteriota bacterium]
MKSKKINIIIAVSGRICSGKSTVSNLISNQFGIPVASFGEYLKYYFKKNKLEMDRNKMQDVGSKLMISNPEMFLSNVINYFISHHKSLIIEGVRHRILIDLIKQQCEEFLLIYLDADLRSRFERYSKRNKVIDSKLTYEKFLELDNHVVEKEIESLKLISNKVFNTTVPYKEDLLRLVDQKIPK